MTEWTIERQRTAIGRGDLSMPVRLSLRDEIVKSTTSVLDYGCGRGQDVSRLKAMGFDAHGWDPFFAPEEPLITHDVVLLNYVLNVIEDKTERRETLERAWKLATDALIVSCRLKWELGSLNATPAGDGVITSRNTFQHFYSPSEVRQLVEEVTGQRCVSPSPGVVYVFRRDEDRFAYLARGAITSFEWTESQDYASAVAELCRSPRTEGDPLCSRRFRQSFSRCLVGSPDAR